jgi:hypothetical protein
MTWITESELIDRWGRDKTPLHSQAKQVYL